MARRPIPHDDTLMDIYDVAALFRYTRSTRQAYRIMAKSGIRPVSGMSSKRWWRSEVIAWLSAGGQEVARQEPMEQVKQPGKKKRGEPDLSMIGACRGLTRQRIAVQ